MDDGQTLLKSCSECTDKCCNIGPGPWKPVPFMKWLSEHKEGTMCEDWDQDTGLCKVWDKKPMLCKWSLCGKKYFDSGDLLTSNMEMYNYIINQSGIGGAFDAG